MNVSGASSKKLVNESTVNHHESGKNYRIRNSQTSLKSSSFTADLRPRSPMAKGTSNFSTELLAAITKRRATLKRQEESTKISMLDAQSTRSATANKLAPAVKPKPKVVPLKPVNIRRTQITKPQQVRPLPPQIVRFLTPPDDIDSLSPPMMPSFATPVKKIPVSSVSTQAIRLKTSERSLQQAASASKVPPIPPKPNKKLPLIPPSARAVKRSANPPQKMPKPVLLAQANPLHKLTSQHEIEAAIDQINIEMAEQKLATALAQNDYQDLAQNSRMLRDALVRVRIGKNPWPSL